MKMKLSERFLKYTYKLLILMILFVCMFILSGLLYSVRYWPDIYNYLHPNITIKRIPTISEVDFDIINVKVDYTTETYSTTDAEYFEITTIDDFDINEFMNKEFQMKSYSKRDVPIVEMNEVRETLNTAVLDDYHFLEEPLKQNKETIELATELALLQKQYGVNDLESDPINRREEKKTEAESKNELDGYLVGHVRNLDTYNREYALEPFIFKQFGRDKEGSTSWEYLRDMVEMSKLLKRNLVVELVTEDADAKEETMQFQPIDNTSLLVKEATKKQKTQPETPQWTCKNNKTCESFKHTVFPWVVTIFIKNDSEHSQFHYYCDGALLSDIVVITGGRCMIIMNQTVLPENVLVFLGKGNLHATADTEKLHSVREINIHPNFSMPNEHKVTNDLALLILSEPALFADNIQGACIHYNETEKLEDSGTTAWGPNGQLIPIFFEKTDDATCPALGENLFCATYSLSVALCPSYGGIYAAKRQNRWCLQGLFYGNPADRGLCFNRSVLFTSLKSYINWIDDTIVNKYIL